MKINILLFSILLLGVQSSFSQKIFFAKENYSDSSLLVKNIPLLAKEVIAQYKETDTIDYLDNLFRLQIVAQQYVAVEATITKLTLLSVDDTIVANAVGFAYRIYSATMCTNPTTENFASSYNNIFTDSYNELNYDGKTLAEQYFDRDLVDIRNVFISKTKEFANTDSITIPQAVALCRSYCSLLCFNATLSLANARLLSFEQEKYIKQDSILLKMPDGGTISLTVVRDKKNHSPQPVVLVYNIYASSNAAANCKEIVNRGYVGIVADTRGKRLSPDKIEPFEHDAKDAFYIIDWISKQPWCNGKVGMYGGSYLGFSQWSAVKYVHPALKTIVPQVAVGAGIDYPMQNGVFMTYMLPWIHYVTNNKLTDFAEFNNEEKWNGLYANWYKLGKSFRSLDSLEGRPNAIFQRWLMHPSYDSFWQNMTPQKQEFAKINIPILTTTGYWDDDQLGAMHYYHQYQKYNKSNNHYLLIGPYDHFGSQGYPRRKLAGYTIDSIANISITDIVFQWFDYTLKDSMLPSILKDKVNFEVMGRNEWRHVSSLKEMSNDTMHFYFDNKFVNNRYSLVTKKPVKQEFITQTVDFKDRTELRFSSEDLTIGRAIIDSILQPESHKFIFVSDAIDKPFAISGAASASITVAVNKKDFDVGFDLYEQTPDGKYFGLVTNLQRASYAADNTKRNLLTPGKVHTIEMKQTYITCRQLSKGSRIIVVFGINKNPQWQVNYGTGKDVSEETIKDASIPLVIKWYNSSFISIPILK